MLLRQTSIVIRKKLLTFQLYELPKEDSEWRNFRILRLDHHIEVRGRAKVFTISWNGAQFGNRGRLRLRHPEILAWAKDEIRRWHP